MIEELIRSGLFKTKVIDLKRNDLLIREGQKENHLYYVKTGALRAFTQIEDEEFTIRLAYSDSIVASIPSFFTEEPSGLFIEAIRKSTVFQINKSEFEDYFAQDEMHLKQYNALLKDLVASFYEREIDLLTSSPAERIQRMLKRSPHVFQEIPHKYIASYLRMSPETLSRFINVD